MCWDGDFHVTEHAGDFITDYRERVRWTTTI